LLETYEAAVSQVGLRGMASVVTALGKRRDALETAARESESGKRLHVLLGELLRRKAQGS
jgi:hypothetical protein